MAQELHDLVAHYATGIVVQAQAAEVVADGDANAAGVALVRIEEAGRDSLAVMRAMVGSLRAADGGGATVAPTAAPRGVARRGGPGRPQSGCP